MGCMNSLRAIYGPTNSRLFNTNKNNAYLFKNLSATINRLPEKKIGNNIPFIVEKMSSNDYLLSVKCYTNLNGAIRQVRLS